ncbi:MAG: hypothetical protein VW683_03965 [Betaproteobacteria bacterium]
MPLPADATKVHLDAASDDPKQARSELADLVDKFNSLKGVLGDGVELDVGAGLASSSGNLIISVGSSDTITIDCGSIA